MTAHCPTDSSNHAWHIECSSKRYELWECSKCKQTDLRRFRRFRNPPPDSAERPCGGSGGQSPPAPVNGALPSEAAQNVEEVLRTVWPSNNLRGMVGRMYTGEAIAQFREFTPIQVKDIAKSVLCVAPIRAKLLAEMILELVDEPWPRVEEGASS